MFWNELGGMISFVEVPRQQKEETFYCFTIRYYYYCSFVLSCCVPAGRLGLGGGWCYWIGNLICARISINLLRFLFNIGLIRIDCIRISVLMIDNCSSSLGGLRAKLMGSHISYQRWNWVPTEERGCWATVAFNECSATGLIPQILQL